MFTREQARKLAERVLSFSTFPECQVNLNELEQLNVRFANNGVTTSGFAIERTVVISSSRDQKTGMSQTDQIDDDSLRAAVKRSEELAAIAPPSAEHMPPLGKQEYPSLDRFDGETAAARSPQLIPQVRAILDAAVKSKLVAAGFFVRTASAVAIANKAGLYGYGRSTDANLSTTLRNPEGTSSGWAAQPAIRVREIDGASIADRAIGKCTRWKNPVKLEPGKYTVVLEPAAVCNLVGILGGGFRARGAEEGQNFLSKPGGGTMLGEKMFPEMVTLRTDPFDSRLPALPWEGADGLPARAMTWIEKGVVRNLYYDRYWAQKQGKQPTVYPTDLVLDGTDATLDHLIASVSRGLLVTRFWYIRTVNPRTEQATGLTRDGLFLIENGKLASAAMNFRFNESPVRLLQNVKKIGRPVRASSFEGGTMIAPPLVADNFTFTSISDAV